MEKQILFLGKIINFKSEGNGQTVVLLHGFLESIQIWEEFSELLSQKFNVVAIDLPGHGKTDNFSEVHTMEFMADAVKAVLDFLNIGNCVMIGHSMGGYTTLAFAEKYPEYLKGFCLFHSQAEADSPEAKINRDRTVKIVEKDSIGFISNFIPDLFVHENIKRFDKKIEVMKTRAMKTSKEGIIAALLGMKERTSKLNFLKTINIPVLFIVGKQDKRIPTETVLQQAALPSHSEILILGNVGHMGYIEAKEETLKAVVCFVEKLAGH
ncbi:MAG: hypothetical protein B6D61_04555 [Bacteroidetes bacterium 4484_249]|nr:MAG: hypothetical protein B6D61_04555 [Bacteroidetes bacterium 4484_249]